MNSKKDKTMKLTKYFIYPLLTLLALSSCSDDDYKSNDPDAAQGAPAYYDVNDLLQTYSMFYKPSHGWVGDPMPYYENGVFHVFYLQDTRPAPSTYHPWYKATTSNFINYTDAGEMIATGADNSQEDALGTGCVFKNNGKYYAFYTAHNGDLDPKEKIYLATSNDLNTWIKQPSFSFEGPDGYDRNEFRDPFVIEQNGKFKMLVSTRADVGGAWKAVIAQFSSTDLFSWEIDPNQPFAYIDDAEYMVECVDLFTEGSYQYIIYSGIDSRKVYYKYRTVGSTEWITPAINDLDGIRYYAAKSATDGTNRYLFGWNSTTKTHKDDSDVEWGGALVVHQLTQNENGTLNVVINNQIDNQISISKELTVLNHSNDTSNANSYTLNAGGYVTFDRLSDITKITTTIKPTTATVFGFMFAAAGNEREVFNLEFDTQNNTVILNRVLKYTNETIERTRKDIPVTTNGKYSIKLLIENSICVLYINNEVAFTNRIYFMNHNPWRIYSTNGDVLFDQVGLYK